MDLSAVPQKRLYRVVVTEPGQTIDVDDDGIRTAVQNRHVKNYFVYDAVSEDDAIRRIKEGRYATSKSNLEFHAKRINNATGLEDVFVENI